MQAEGSTPLASRLLTLAQICFAWAINDHLCVPCNRVETAEHLSKLTEQTTVVKEQLTRSGHGWSPHISRTTQEISRPLLTADEAMRMKGPNKDRNGLITEPGHMVVYVAGYPAIHGIQPLYFKDPELSRRAQIPADSAHRAELQIA